MVFTDEDGKQLTLKPILPEQNEEEEEEEEESDSSSSSGLSDLDIGLISGGVGLFVIIVVIVVYQSAIRKATYKIVGNSEFVNHL